MSKTYLTVLDRQKVAFIAIIESKEATFDQERKVYQRKLMEQENTLEDKDTTIDAGLQALNDLRAENESLSEQLADLQREFAKFQPYMGNDVDWFNILVTPGGGEEIN